MSIHSIKRDYWIESDSLNKGKLNRWLKNCQMINYHHIEKEIAIFNRIQRQHYYMESKRRFTDWKGLAMVRILSRELLIRKTFRRMKVVYKLRQFFKVWFDEWAIKSVRGSFLKWVELLAMMRDRDAAKEREIKRKKAKVYLRRIGRAARYIRIMDQYLYLILRKRLFMKWKNLSQVHEVVSLIHSNYLKSWVMHSIYRMFNRRECCRRVFTIGHKWLRRVFVIWKHYQPPIRRASPPRSPRSPRRPSHPNEVISTSIASIPSIPPPVIDTPAADEIVACTCIRDFMMGRHSHCKLTTHVRLRLQSCHVETNSALKASIEANEVIGQVFSEDIPTVEPRRHPSLGRLQSSASVASEGNWLVSQDNIRSPLRARSAGSARSVNTKGTPKFPSRNSRGNTPSSRSQVPTVSVPESLDVVRQSLTSNVSNITENSSVSYQRSLPPSAHGRPMSRQKTLGKQVERSATSFIGIAAESRALGISIRAVEVKRVKEQTPNPHLGVRARKEAARLHGARQKELVTSINRPGRG